MSATVVSGPPSPVTISETNCWLASSKKDRSNAAVPPSFSTGSPTELSGSGAAIVLKPVPSVTKIPRSKLIDSSNAMSPGLLIDGRESLPSKSLVEAR